MGRVPLGRTRGEGQKFVREAAACIVNNRSWKGGSQRTGVLPQQREARRVHKPGRRDGTATNAAFCPTQWNHPTMCRTCTTSSCRP